jgi:hypothetical protein
MYFYSPPTGECSYLRLLSIAVRGPTSFEHLHSVVITLHPTFQAVCVALGLLEDDREWIDCLTEVSVFAGSRQLCVLSVTALVYVPVTDPAALWDCFATSICDD